MNKRRLFIWVMALCCILLCTGLFFYWPVVGTWAGRMEESMLPRGDPIPGQSPGPDFPLGSVVVQLEGKVRKSKDFYLPLLRFHASLNGYVELPSRVANPDRDVILFIPKGTPLPPGW